MSKILPNQAISILFAWIVASSFSRSGILIDENPSPNPIFNCAIFSIATTNDYKKGSIYEQYQYNMKTFKTCMFKN